MNGNLCFLVQFSWWNFSHNTHWKNQLKKTVIWPTPKSEPISIKIYVFFGFYQMIWDQRENWITIYYYIFTVCGMATCWISHFFLHFGSKKHWISLKFNSYHKCHTHTHFMWRKRREEESSKIGCSITVRSFNWSYLITILFGCPHFVYTYCGSRCGGRFGSTIK